MLSLINRGKPVSHYSGLLLLNVHSSVIMQVPILVGSEASINHAKRAWANHHDYPRSPTLPATDSCLLAKSVYRLKLTIFDLKSGFFSDNN